MLPSFFTQSVIRLRAKTKTERGSVVLDWSKPNEKEITGCSVQPASTSLSEDGRVLGTSDGITVYLPAGADVLAGDRIRFAGEDYTIDGVPRVWPSATGALDHLQLNCVRWSG